MSNPPRAKGTSGEREVLLRLRELYGEKNVVRTPPGSVVDIIATGLGPQQDRFVAPIDALYTRPDAGQWLVTIRASDFEDLLWHGSPNLRVEVKRYRRFAIHAIFESKFPPGH
jgi:hypothetical protein